SAGAPVAPGSKAAGTSAADSMPFGLPLGLLTAPANVGIENPALHHFVLVPAAGSAPGRPSAPAPPVFAATPLGALNVPVPLLASVLVPSLLITVGLILARRLVAVRLRRLMELTAVPFATAAALSLLLLVPKVVPSATADLAAGPAAVSTAPPTVVKVVSTVPAGSTAWRQLTAIERSVTGLENQLQNAPTVTPPVGQEDRPPHAVQLASTNIAAAPPSAAVQLENALQTEYSFYVSLVQHPDQQRGLMSDLQTASAGIRDVVVYNLQAVQTQLAQDAAIQSAQQSALAGAGPVPTTLLAPEVGAITQGFGSTDFAMEPPFTFGGVTYPHFHTGVDIAAPLDTPVAAAADGVVVIVGASTDLQGNLVGYGNYVVIAHAGKMVTLYGHLDRLLVHAGQPVHAGDVIALEGSTGNSTGPHLHFEVRVDGLLADPTRYLGTQIHKR
ncbi:MAG: peptidoglycan DD-metalloendopeptidase family protein, partial [Candidatus Dormibacteraeota bacterium]|nr:peptidoglycan DD-metalloendopeptidase family protein [Candidatus Dormibacteraeota bacterium]